MNAPAKSTPTANVDPNTVIDPSVKIPAAVRAAAKLSDDLLREISGDQSSPEDGVTGEGNQDGSAAPASADASTTAAPASGPVVAPTEPTQPPEPARTAEPRDDWEHKYNSLYGRYTKQEQTIRTLGEQVTNLQNVIATMQAAGAQVEPTKPVEIPMSSLVTEEEVNEYGKDLLDVVGRRAQEIVAPLLSAAEAKIAQLEGQLAGVNGFVAQDARTKLQAALDRDLPTWRDMNTNPDFLAWLSLPDPYSGGIRHDMLKAAYAQGNAPRVLAFFKGFLAEEAAVAPAGQQPVAAPAQKVQKVPLANLAAPGRAKAAAADPAPAQNAKSIITRAEIAEFYANVASGRFKHREAEKAKMEQEIFLATREGRVR